MGTTTKSNVIIPEILADALKGGFAGMPVFSGTGAAIIKTGLSAGRSNVGEEVTVPYFSSLGEAEDLTADGDALTPATLQGTSEKATVRQSGKAFEITRWAQSGVGDPYAEGKRQVLATLGRRIDKGLIEVAKVETGWSDYVNDESSTGAGTLTYDAIVRSLVKFGDENSDLAVFACHSKVYYDLLMIKDSTGRPLIDTRGELPKITPLGIPCKVSDRLTATGGIYPSLLCRKGALVAWVNDQTEIMQDVDILVGADVMAVHLFWAAHRYVHLDGMAKPGVVILKTKAST
jgi:hypothetical protein